MAYTVWYEGDLITAEKLNNTCIDDTFEIKEILTASSEEDVENWDFNKFNKNFELTLTDEQYQDLISKIENLKYIKFTSKLTVNIDNYEGADGQSLSSYVFDEINIPVLRKKYNKETVGEESGDQLWIDGGGDWFHVAHTTGEGDYFDTYTVNIRDKKLTYETKAVSI